MPLLPVDAVRLPYFTTPEGVDTNTEAAEVAGRRLALCKPLAARGNFIVLHSNSSCCTSRMLLLCRRAAHSAADRRRGLEQHGPTLP